MAEDAVIYRSDHVLEYPYVRSVGPVIGAFLTGLRDGKVVGTGASGGRVIVPPTEYDPETGEDDRRAGRGRPGGTVSRGPGWPTRCAKHPLQEPVRLGARAASTGPTPSFLHVLSAPPGPTRSRPACG